MTGILGIGISGLNAAQRALNTTGNNITNVNTPGYSRQRVDLANKNDQLLGGLSIGKGVDVQNVSRIVNEFLNVNIQKSATNVGTMESYNRYATQLDSSLANETIGLSSSLQQFFNSLNSVADDPASISTRQTLLGDTDALTAKFHSLSGQLDQLESGINQDLRANVSQINSLTNSIAEINKGLIQINGRTNGQGTNSLNDQLEQQLNHLSRLMGISTTTQSDGSVSVMTASGQLLVAGATKVDLSTQANALYPSQLDITIPAGAGNAVITDSLSSGEIAGLLDVRADVIDNARNSLGRIAVGLSQAFNAQHRTGEDLDGNAGTNLFSIANPVIVADGAVAATVTAIFDESTIDQLTSSDYELTYDGANYTLTRLSDNSQVYSAAGATFTVEGMDFTVTGAAAGDTFSIQPMRQVASQIGIAITDPREIAAAATGTGVGDNSNVLTLADLQFSLTLDGGNSNFNDAYGQIIGDIGSKTRQAKISLEAMQAVQENAANARDSVSGVNLDEEAADLIKFQQAYQAAARVISVSNDIFGTLLQAVGR